MKAVGIIAEYDPFHNGHLYHLRHAMEISGADASVAVISGSFAQRGLPSFFDKTVRTRAALACGVDLVLELPYIYACNSGREFARGGMAILDSLGVVTDFVFGAECGDISELKRVAGVSGSFEEISELQERRKLLVRKFMKSGMSYPAAVCQTVSEMLGQEAGNLLREPNNVLGIEYLRALCELGSEMEPHCVKRKGAFHDRQESLSSVGAPIDRMRAAGRRRSRKNFASDVSSGYTGCATQPDDCYRDEAEPDAKRELFASGSTLRRLIAKQGVGSIREFVPASAVSILTDASFFKQQGMDRLYGLLRYKLLTTDRARLAEIYSVAEGLENRLQRAALEAENYREFLEFAGTKRYTDARIRRTAIHVLTDFTTCEFESLRGASYARVLGFSETGARLLRQIKKAGRTEIVSNLSRLNLLSEKTASCLRREMKASALYQMLNGGSFSFDGERRFVPVRCSREDGIFKELID